LKNRQSLINISEHQNEYQQNLIAAAASIKAKEKMGVTTSLKKKVQKIISRKHKSGILHSSQLEHHKRSVQKTKTEDMLGN